MGRPHIQRNSWFFIFLALLFLLPAGRVGAEQSAAGSLIRTSTMEIDARTSHAVTISERHFRVTTRTVILDEQGVEIPLSLLPVPCTADIEYELQMDKDPECLKIQVQKRMSLSEYYRTTSSLER